MMDIPYLLVPLNFTFGMTSLLLYLSRTVLSAVNGADEEIFPMGGITSGCKVPVPRFSSLTDMTKSVCPTLMGNSEGFWNWSVMLYNELLSFLCITLLSSMEMLR